MGITPPKDFEKRIEEQFPTGITLVVVAGVNYAAYVERRGLGGMTGAELDARRKAEDIIQGLVNDINKLTK